MQKVGIELLPDISQIAPETKRQVLQVRNYKLQSPASGCQGLTLFFVRLLAVIDCGYTRFSIVQNRENMASHRTIQLVRAVS